MYNRFKAGGKEMSIIKYIKSLFIKEPKHTFTEDQIVRFKNACCWDENSRFRK